MAKEVMVKIKLQIKGGEDKLPPAVGSSLGQHKVNIMDFWKKFTAETAGRKGEIIPVVISVYTDRTCSYVIKTPPASALILKKAGLAKGSSRPEDIVGKITEQDIEEIAKIKMADLNAHTLEQAKKTIAGSARSMGIEVVN